MSNRRTADREIVRGREKRWNSYSIDSIVSRRRDSSRELREVSRFERPETCTFPQFAAGGFGSSEDLSDHGLRAEAATLAAWPCRSRTTPCSETPAPALSSDETARSTGCASPASTRRPALPPSLGSQGTVGGSSGRRGR